ncbi:MAG TPA: IS1595 family transposase [Gammaproteobacteria bacterium]|nr:IS1595 family transposase [Gammaproteobacteria bacterium]
MPKPATPTSMPYGGKIALSNVPTATAPRSVPGAPITTGQGSGATGAPAVGAPSSLGRRPRRRRKKREPGRGHYDKDRPAMIAWVSRQGPVVVQAVKDFTVKTVQQATDLTVQAGSRLYTDSASSYRALKGYVHAFVNHTKKEYVRGEVHENRTECLFSLLKPYLRVFRGISKSNLPGYVGFFQFLRNVRQRNAFEQAELILQAALAPCVAHQARKGEFVTCFDHFDLLQTPIN